MDGSSFVCVCSLGGRWQQTDISFLDDVKRARDVARKSRPVPPRKDLPHFMKNLRYQARKRGVRLLFLQPGMKRRKENSTFYNKAKDQPAWRIEWQFHSVQDTFIDHRYVPSSSRKTNRQFRERERGLNSLQAGAMRIYL